MGEFIEFMKKAVIVILGFILVGVIFGALFWLFLFALGALLG